MDVRRYFRWLLICTLALLWNSAVAIHGGYTDPNGGHHDLKSGSYHFHHKGQAHQHWLGYCPVDKEFKTTEWVMILVVAILYVMYYRFLKQKPITINS
jgi:hypothetical protein